MQLKVKKETQNLKPETRNCKPENLSFGEFPEQTMTTKVAKLRGSVHLGFKKTETMTDVLVWRPFLEPRNSKPS